MVGTPADLTVEATLPTGQPVAYTLPTATDAQTSAAVPVTCAPLSGTIFPFGATTVTFDASAYGENCLDGATHYFVGQPELLAQAAQTCIDWMRERQLLD